MTNPNMEGLPPEMQARIAQIIEGAKQNAVAQAAPAAPAAPPAPPAPPVRQPNLMDHVIMLRQEVDQMRQQLEAVGQVTDAVGQAVGSLYQMFHQQTEPTSASANFQAARSPEVSEDY